LAAFGKNPGEEEIPRNIFGWKSSEGGRSTIDVTTTPTFQAGTPKVLFRLPGPLVGSSPEGVSRDGQRFVFAMPITTSTTAR
jgi:hypothetical protein